ncbi:hypothetical protein ANCCAN_19088 [Ancylostoma caninum]|uniref:Uncharacterized protein n=1 Tax=Ancylostoma caninum TaxID=29170 RepID=A0A368FXN9_ANCCA|nr:hypothetical protein ANCCAN_19088 [Ancylostoma caninum]
MKEKKVYCLTCFSWHGTNVSPPYSITFPSVSAAVPRTDATLEEEMVASSLCLTKYGNECWAAGMLSQNKSTKKSKNSGPRKRWPGSSTLPISMMTYPAALHEGTGIQRIQRREKFTYPSGAWTVQQMKIKLTTLICALLSISFTSIPTQWSYCRN